MLIATMMNGSIWKKPFDTKFCTIIKKTSKILTYKSLLSIVQRNIRIRNHSSHSYL